MTKLQTQKLKQQQILKTQTWNYFKNAKCDKTKKSYSDNLTSEEKKLTIVSWLEQLDTLTTYEMYSVQRFNILFF